MPGGGCLDWRVAAQQSRDGTLRGRRQEIFVECRPSSLRRSIWASLGDCGRPKCGACAGVSLWQFDHRDGRRLLRARGGSHLPGELGIAAVPVPIVAPL